MGPKVKSNGLKLERDMEPAVTYEKMAGTWRRGNVKMLSDRAARY